MNKLELYDDEETEELLAEDHGGLPEDQDESLGPEIERILKNAPEAKDIYE